MDVKLEKAMLTWLPAFGSWKERGEPDCEVIEHPQRGKGKKLPYSVCACMFGWEKMSPMGRRLQLMIEAWHAVARDGVPIEKVHEALMVIPEYRKMLSGDFRLFRDREKV